MPFDLVANQSVIIAIRYEHSRTIEVTTNSPLIDHFLQKVKLSIRRVPVCLALLLIVVSLPSRLFLQSFTSSILMPFLAIPSHRYDETGNSTNLVRAFTEDNLIASLIVSRRKIYRRSLKSFPPGGIER
jgi:hypothetical protein